MDLHHFFILGHAYSFQGITFFILSLPVVDYLILVFTDRCGGDGTKQPGLWLNKIKQFGTGKLTGWKDKLKNGGFGS
jgi:hypothetical protein